MKHQLESIAVVGTTEVDGEKMDVCAEIVSDYNQSKEELSVKMDCYLRHPDPTNGHQRVKAAWLPEPQDVHECVDREEATDLAREIARSWRKRVFASIPMHAGDGFSQETSAPALLMLCADM